ncbi:P63C domain-containing protein [Roseomonas sp. AR75]|uniref:P63C domain-containing protein n=1 Tax=Roseomonas sp. AR75 TaxID=2562311 RepID=UPI0010C042EF|nr:P63C domain-containing protein [Roseomonas sp. AR75]
MSDTKQSRGGKARAAKLSGPERRQIAKKAADARWALPRATHEGTLTIPGIVPLRVANLNDGRRVLISRAFLEALGRPWKGTYKRTERPNFLDAKNLDGFVTDEVREFLEPIEYVSERGQVVTGYRAELLPLVCDVYLQARAHNSLNPAQQAVAEYAERLVRGLARTGIIALVDDATGYTKLRARSELQAILAAYVAPELLPWSKKFPDSFYEELHRVRGWRYAPGSNARNHYIGKLTNELIYRQLPEGVLEELRRKNPRDPEKGRRRFTHHRFLTDEVGNPHLEKQIVAVTTLLSVADDWQDFTRLFVKKFPPGPGDLFAMPPPGDLAEGDSPP